MNRIIEGFEQLHRMGIQVVYKGVIYIKTGAGWCASGVVDKGLRHTEIPDGVTSIGERAFIDSDIETVRLPDTLLSIEDMAFIGCHRLKEITIPKTVRNIGKSCFWAARIKILNFDETESRPVKINENAFHYTDLETVTCRKAVLGTGAFSFCQKLKSVTFEDCIPFGSKILAGCSSLTTVALRCIPMKHIACYDMFQGCENIEEVILSGETWKISIPLFRDCKKLTHVVVPEGTKQISGILKESHISSISLPNSLHTIKTEAFAGCENLKSLKLPENLKCIEAGAFVSCKHLADITIPEGVEQLAPMTFKSSGLRSIKLSNGLKEIGKNAFEDCANLRYIDIPDTVATIHPKAFCGSGLHTVKLSSKSLETSAEALRYIFHDCPKLKEIHLLCNRSGDVEKQVAQILGDMSTKVTYIEDVR